MHFEINPGRRAAAYIGWTEGHEMRFGPYEGSAATLTGRD